MTSEDLEVLARYSVVTGHSDPGTSIYDPDVAGIISHKGDPPCRWATAVPPIGNMAQMVEEVLKHEKEYHGRSMRASNGED